jgi:hypothetical protein
VDSLRADSSFAISTLILAISASDDMGFVCWHVRREAVRVQAVYHAALGPRPRRNPLLAGLPFAYFFHVAVTRLSSRTCRAFNPRPLPSCFNRLVRSALPAAIGNEGSSPPFAHSISTTPTGVSCWCACYYARQLLTMNATKSNPLALLFLCRSRTFGPFLKVNTALPVLS